jgi:hypothetical protein
VAQNGMASSLQTTARIAATYQRALADEQKVLLLLPRAAAKEAKKKNVAALGFSPGAEQELERFLRRHPEPPQDPRATADRHRSAHRKAMAESMPKYRPSDLIHANLQESWIPYAELLLKEAAQLKGDDFFALKPQLKELGFDEKILGYFLEIQGRKYFLQQTAASIATLIVSRRLGDKGIRVDEETVRRAGKRVYARIRSSKKRK